VGGLPNFWKQHNPGKSKACQLTLEKKKKMATAQRLQPRLQSFFTERPKVPVPPTVPISRHVIAHVIEPSSSVTNVSALSPIPNTFINTLLTDLEKAIGNLPGIHPDATEIEELTTFPYIFPPNMDCDDAWIFILDPHLNRFLGFGKSVESIAESLKGQKKALVSLAKFLREFTRRLRTDEAHLKEKVQQLMDAIKLLCVSF